MRTKIIMLFSLCLLLAGRANAQWVVTDPSNLAQGIVNTTKQIVQTSSTASNMIKNFQETVKIYEQGKKILRCAEIREQFGEGCPKGAENHPDDR